MNDANKKLWVCEACVNRSDKIVARVLVQADTDYHAKQIALSKILKNPGIFFIGSMTVEPVSSFGTSVRTVCFDIL